MNVHKILLILTKEFFIVDGKLILLENTLVLRDLCGTFKIIEDFNINLDGIGDCVVSLSVHYVCVTSLVFSGFNDSTLLVSSCDLDFISNPF